ncbi:MAG: DUF4465 domain-containing protein [Planctomycetota bacterium]|jgi:hypothetical protein
MASRRLMILGLVLTLSATSAQGVINVDFEDLSLEGSEASWSGTYPVDGTGGSGEVTTFTSRGVAFNNFSDGDWYFWEGFAYSNMSDTTTPGYGNQFSAFTGTGYNAGDDIYVAGFAGYSTIPTVTFAEPTVVAGGYFTNTTYTALAMLNGEGPAKKFGGVTGDDDDWFVLTITGRDAAGEATESVPFYLGDYRFADNGLDYVVDAWEYVELSSLGVVKSLEFSLTSSDVGEWGMNTPAYFAMDNLVIPEPVTLALLAFGGLVVWRRRA